MSGPYVLLQFGRDPFNYKLEDLEGRNAFTMYVIYWPRNFCKLICDASDQVGLPNAARDVRQ